MDRRREPLPTRVEDTEPLPAAYDAALRDGLSDLGISLAPAALRAIEGHVRLLLAWTAAINLTAIREPSAVALGHVVDSLSAVRAIRERGPRRLLDLGSGGGFPGVPLAAALPALGGPTGAPEVTLLEPIGKKARFLEVVARTVGLTDRPAVVPRRAEEVARDRATRETWDVVTARAVGSTADLVELAFPLLAPGGALVAWKRGDIAAELDRAAPAIEALGGGTLEVRDVDVRGLPGHRLVVVQRSTAGHVSDRFPRDPGQRRRRPW